MKRFIKSAGCDRKIKYKTPEEAEKKRKEFKLKENDTSLRSYKCPHCRYWHLGHKV